MSQVQRKVVLCNISIPDLGGGTAVTPAVQIPNGATKVTVQFMYTEIDAPVGCILYQSLDGANFDECQTIDETQIRIDLDIDSVSMTLNVSDLLTSWIRFLIESGDAQTGILEKIIILFGN